MFEVGPEDMMPVLDLLRPDEALKSASKVESAYHKADRAIQQVLELLAA
jgi:hypothetical protein